MPEKHVKFGYQPDKIIIHDFCSDVKPGQMVAIVGPTGAGNAFCIRASVLVSTELVASSRIKIRLSARIALAIVKSCFCPPMRFYDVNGGCIKVDGHDIREFNRSELRESFGMVLQDTWLFKGTIMENIRYGRLDATDEEVIAAAKAAHAHHFIQTLPGGYQMELNEDASNVSGGQKQLLT